MLDPTEALKHIKTLAVAGRDADSKDMMHGHFSEIIQLVENALKPDQFAERLAEKGIYPMGDPRNRAPDAPPAIG